MESQKLYSLIFAVFSICSTLVFNYISFSFSLQHFYVFAQSAFPARHNNTKSLAPAAYHRVHPIQRFPFLKFSGMLLLFLAVVQI